MTYDKATPIQTDVALFLAALMAGFYPKQSNQIWADIGCGTGKLSQAVLSKIQHSSIEKWYGVDNSPAMLEIWQKNCQTFYPPTISSPSNSLARANAIRPYQAQSNIPILTPILADMMALPFADNSVDVVMSSFALHWATPTVISELGRVVKKGGYLFLAIPVEGSFREVSERFPKLPIFPFLPSEDWQQAIYQLIGQRQGEVYFCEEIQFSHIYPNLKILLTELKKMGGAVSGKKPVDTATLRHYLKDASPVNLDYRILMVGVNLN